MTRSAAAVLVLALLTGGASLRRRRDPARVLERYYRAWSAGDAEGVRALLSDGYRGHVHALAGVEERDADDAVAAVESHADAFAETEFSVEDVIADHHRVAGRVSLHARHRETGREGTIRGLVILGLDGRRIAEEWASWDYLGLARQLGLSEAA